MNIEPDMRIQNLRIPRSLLQDPNFGGEHDGDCQRGTLILRRGKVSALVAEAPSGPARMVLPKLTEAHCHLDKCHSIHRLGDVGGDLMHAIDAQARDKAKWTEEDLAHRAGQGLAESLAAGCGTLRSHIDWGDTSEPPLAWHVLPALGHDGLTCQWAALTGIDQLADLNFARGVADHVARTRGGVLGSFVLHHPGEVTRQGLLNAFAQADRLGLALDFHVDESLDNLNGVEAIADVALELQHQGPILIGHAVALMNKSGEDVARIADKLARAGITVCVLPTTNLYLQGRRDGTPDRRGLTRLRELGERGVPVIVGSDNVADAFCPLGQHDPMAALHLACLAAHLDPPLARLLPMVTVDARRSLGMPPISVDTASADQLLISDAATTAGLIAGQGHFTPLVEHLHPTPT